MSTKGVFSWMELLAPLRGIRPLIAGIVNVTPDSFSDGRGHISYSERISFALHLLDEGADILDLGGESTRPGAVEVPFEEEWNRLEPVIDGILSSRPEACLSIDTRHAQTAQRALDAGARIINDVSGLQFDSAMSGVIAEWGAGVIITHSTGIPEIMQSYALTGPAAVETVRRDLQQILDRTFAAKILPEQIMLDAGIGFGKTREANFQLLKHAGELENVLGYPFCWGVSRKSLFKSNPDTLENRIASSLAAAVKLAEQNIALLRVHDVSATLSALAAAAEIAGQ